jgi:hypothetical protein
VVEDVVPERAVRPGLRRLIAEALSAALTGTKTQEI